ncbi:MAG TPA: hypothetical protein PLF40_02515 [Kofleriaceae bacterium]|nr:hypothetical protein [Kofleriaceae bacterium]
MKMFENGIDYVQSAVVAFYSNPPPSGNELKYCVLHAFSGTLLILKERLRREHPALIWKDVTHLNDDSKNTVDYDALLNRLAQCANVRLKGKERELLDEVRQTRNKIEHYEFVLKADKTSELLGRLTEFLERFLRDELKKTLKEVVPVDVWRNISKLEAIAKRIEQERRKEEAARCKEEEAATQKWLTRARKYMRWSKPALARYADKCERPRLTKRDLDNPDGMECDECNEYSVYIAPGKKDGDIGLCIKPDCRAVHQLDSCAKCSAICVGELCDNCADYLQYQMAQD